MIITKIIGGLGNQIFQYAAALALAARHETECVLDVTAFERYKLHKFALEHFAIDARIGDTAEMKRLARRVGMPPRWRPWASKFRLFKETYFNFEEDFDSLPDNCYLDGYWQSERYFRLIGTELRRTLTLTSELNGEDRELLDRISSRVTASVHIRRADYVNNKETLSYHGTCSEEYYKRALVLLAEKGVEQFVIFSDDHAWAAEHITGPGTVIVAAHNDSSRNFADLWLMSRCAHHVIANSTFSWWGAWLDPSASKTVIAPQNWFSDTRLDCRDLYPAGWLRL